MILTTQNSNEYSDYREWKIRVSTYAVGGLPLSLTSLIPAATVQERKKIRRCNNTTEKSDMSFGGGGGGDGGSPSTAIPTNANSCVDPGKDNNDNTDILLRPSVSNATHDCFWDRDVKMPVRWRDLPRDAYLLFEVIGCGDRVVRFITNCLWCCFILSFEPIKTKQCVICILSPTPMYRYSKRRCLYSVGTGNSLLDYVR